MWDYRNNEYSKLPYVKEKIVFLLEEEKMLD